MYIPRTLFSHLFLQSCSPTYFSSSLSKCLQSPNSATVRCSARGQSIVAVQRHGQLIFSKCPSTAILAAILVLIQPAITPIKCLFYCRLLRTWTRLEGLVSSSVFAKEWQSAVWWWPPGAETLTDISCLSAGNAIIFRFAAWRRHVTIGYMKDTRRYRVTQSRPYSRILSCMSEKIIKRVWCIRRVCTYCIGLSVILKALLRFSFDRTLLHFLT